MPLPGLPYSDAQIFPIINVALPAYILLVIAPRHKLVQAYVNLVTALMSVLYVGLLYTLITQKNSKFSFAEMATYEGVSKLFKLQDVVLAAWVHYVAFDLWTARWIALDAASRRFPKLLLAPTLAATLLAGPAGWLVYMFLRGNWRAKSKAE